MSLCLPSAQLKDDFKRFESSLTKPETTVPSHFKSLTYKFLKQRRKGALKDTTSPPLHSQQLHYCFERGLRFEIQNQRLTGFEHLTSISPHSVENPGSII